MFEIFKNVLLLSVFGGIITLVLLLLKPLTAKRFAAKWQYYIWFVATICMLIPVWKLLPQCEAQKTVLQIAENQIAMQSKADEQTDVPIQIYTDTPMEYREISTANGTQIRIYDLAELVFFLPVRLSATFFFLLKKEKKA